MKKNMMHHVTVQQCIQLAATERYLTPNGWVIPYWLQLMWETVQVPVEPTPQVRYARKIRIWLGALCEAIRFRVGNRLAGWLSN